VTLTLRAATLADIPRMHQIEEDAAELFAGLGLIDIDDMAVVGIGDHGRAIDAGLSLVAEVDGRVAGFGMADAHMPDIYLHELDVDRQYQRKGVGAALVRGLIDVARSKKATSLYLSTFRDPPWNAPFYRKLGFQDVVRGDYLRWMVDIEREQAKFLDVNTRVFMRFGL